MGHQVEERWRRYDDANWSGQLAGMTDEEVAAALGVSRFAMRRLWARRQSAQRNCKLCGAALPWSATRRQDFCNDAHRAKFRRALGPAS
jgi:hypothetical protein